MIDEKTLHVRVGIFVTAGILLAMVIIFMIGSERAWFESKYRLYSTFSDVSGVGPGAAVSLAGMRIGSVARVHFPEDLERKEVIVELQLARDFQDRIRADSEASIVTQGLLGDKQVIITVGGAEAEPLKDGEHIQSKAAGDFASIGKNASELIVDVSDVMKEFKTALDNAKEGKGVLHALLYDPEGGELISDISAGVRSFRRLAHRFEKEDVGRAMANLEQASRDIKIITGQIRRGEGTVGGLLTDASIYNDLRSLFGRANRNVVLKGVVRSMLRERERTVTRP